MSNNYTRFEKTLKQMSDNEKLCAYIKNIDICEEQTRMHI